MVIFLIDADNLSSPAWIEEACVGLEASEGTLTVRRAYGSAENLKGLAQVMLGRAIRPFVNLSLSKNTTDVALAVDAMELACQLPKPTVIAIGSGDADFVPLVVRLRERGIRMVCVSERTKMAAEAINAYDAVIFVGKDTIKPTAEIEPPPPTKKKPAKKATVKQVAVAKAPAAMSENLKPKGRPKSATTRAKGEVTLAQVLEAAPALKSGQVQPLGDIVQQLHAAKLIGKNATSTRLFKKFPDKFELIPDKQPNQVRYVSA